MNSLSIWQIALLALMQGLAELLPVSNSAHVIFTQRLMGLDPGAPEMTFLLVMLHTGTMFAVLAYFWKRWTRILKGEQGRAFVKQVVIATVCTGILGLALKVLIEKVVLEKILGHSKGEVEHLFRNLPMMAAALAAAGLVILAAAFRERRAERDRLETREAVAVGLIQGLCLPFRGFSRSGATISAAMYAGISRMLAEDFSFALAVVLTPPVIVLELHRLTKAVAMDQRCAVNADACIHWGSLLGPGLIGMVFSFLAGLVALRWLSSWLEKGRWHYFGYYCLAFSAVVLAYYFSQGGA